MLLKEGLLAGPLRLLRSPGVAGFGVLAVRGSFDACRILRGLSARLDVASAASATRGAGGGLRFVLWQVRWCCQGHPVRLDRNSALQRQTLVSRR